MPTPRAVAIVIEGDQVLLIKRYVRNNSSRDCPICRDRGAGGPHCAGHHYAVLPGGHVEQDESYEAAALRELHEETTLTASIDRLLWTGFHNDRPASYFLMKSVAGTPALSGEEALDNCPDNSFAVIWAGADEFRHLNLRPVDIHEPLAELLRP